ncbi:MAG: DUF6491 family protein [Pseudomonadota bacterium]
MTAKLILMSAGAAFLAACATAGDSYVMSEEAVTELAKYERTGELTNCLSLRDLNIDALDERTFLVRSGVNDYYLAELENSCLSVDRAFTRIQIDTFGSQLCEKEIVRVVDNTTGNTVGSCGMSKFERLVEKS